MENDLGKYCRLLLKLIEMIEIDLKNIIEITDDDDLDELFIKVNSLKTLLEILTKLSNI